MVGSESGRLGWIPPGRRLADTLRRAEILASEQAHRELTLEHVLLALTVDTDAARVLEANGVNVARIRDYLARYLAAVDDRWPADALGTAEPDETLKRIFDVASAAAESSGRGEIDGALIVAAIIGEGKSTAAAMLRQHGLNIDDDSVADTGASGEKRAAAQDSPPVVPEATGAAVTVPDATATSPVAPQQNLSDIHRILSRSGGATVLANGGNGPVSTSHTRYQNSVSDAAAAPRDVLPVLQRTRPKIKPAKTIEQPSNARPLMPAQSLAGQSQRGQGTAGSIPAAAQPPIPSPVPAPPPAPPRGTGIPTTDVAHLPADVPEDDTAPAAPPPTEGFAEDDVNILHDILPRKMRIGVPEIVEIRVMNSDIDALTGQFEGHDVAHSGAKLVSRSLCLRLRSPSGSFVIEPRSPEVQWIDVIAGFADDDITSWRWLITGQRRGTARLQLVASARTVNSEGVALETAMPDQVASLRITRGFGAVTRRFVMLSGLFLAGCAAGLFAHPLYRLIEGMLA